MDYDTIPFKEIKEWYYLNGKPTRQDVREGKVTIPPSTSKPLIEALLPYLSNSAKNNNIIVSPTIEDKAETSMVITSDWHIPFEDQEALKVFLNFLKEYQPDELVLNGNINDCTGFSTHPKLREVALAFKSVKDDLKKWYSIAEYLRDILPNTKITYIGSQCHEGWIDKWASLSPITLEDENYTIPKLLRLEDFGIDYEREVYDCLGDGTFIITHGTIARGKSGASAHAELEMDGTNVCIAHTHKLSQIYKTNQIGTYTALECGCMCRRIPWYHLKGRRLMMDWQQGFALVNFKDNSFSSCVVPIIRDGEDKPYFWIGKERYR